MYNKKKEG